MDKKEIVRLQEAERKRIAEELHDTTIQDLVCLSQQLELIFMYMEQDLTRAKLETVAARQQVKGIIGEMREIIYSLRPMMIDNIGWYILFERLREKLLRSNPNLQIFFDIDMVDCSDGVTAVSIYRIVREACQNAIKHSDAVCIVVSVKNSEELIKISIRDDGAGIDTEKNYYQNHFGLKFMGERVDALSGTMCIVSNASGTRIEIELPAESGVCQ